jgi:DNA topoisomerase-1
VEVSAGDYLLRTKGSVQRFAGWLALYQAETPSEGDATGATGTPSDASPEADDGATSDLLPALTEGDRLELRTLDPQQKFTQPPPRFSEATLVKELEENGIGRPSTYASIIGVLQTREYAEKVDARFRPTRLGRLVIDLLAESFQDILAVDYTRSLEDQLDKIEGGEADYRTMLDTFYKKFSSDLGQAAESMPNIKIGGLPSEEVCDKCNSPMVVKVGKFGVFLACSAYPDCSNTREVEQADQPAADEEPDACENCGKPMLVKRGRFGQFLACSAYPECKTTRKLIETKGGLTAAKPDQMLDEKCPKCESNLVVKQGRFGEFTACSNYPACKYVKLKSTGVVCPKDGGDVVERKSKRGRAFYGCDNYPKCDFTLWNRPLAEVCPKCSAPYLVEKITKRWGHQVLCDNEDCDYERTEEAASA